MPKRVVLIGRWAERERIARVAAELRARLGGVDVINFVEDGVGPCADPDSELAAYRWRARVEELEAADMGVLVSPAGADSWMEVGYLHGRGADVLGLSTKGERVGLHRHMVVWLDESEPADNLFLQAVKAALCEATAL